MPWVAAALDVIAQRVRAGSHTWWAESDVLWWGRVCVQVMDGKDRGPTGVCWKGMIPITEESVVTTREDGTIELRNPDRAWELVAVRDGHCDA